MRIEDLKAGDKVYIKDDLKVFKVYGNDIFMPDMQTGLQEVDAEATEYRKKIKVADNISYYTSEMIDWEKTAMLNKNIPQKDTSNIKPTYNGTVLSWDDIEVTRHRDDKENLEKAVMMLLLKKEGYSFVDV